MAKVTRSGIHRKIIDQVLTGFGVLATIALLIMGTLAWWAYSFTTSNVRTELVSQYIYFPAKGSAALASPDIGPYLNKYAGEQLVTGVQARAYADHFIAVHLKEIAGGKTYAEVSAEAQASPTDASLKAKQQTLFQGETLRGMLLNAYAFWTVGYIAQLAALACFAAAAIMAILTLLGFWHLSRYY